MWTRVIAAGAAAVVLVTGGLAFAQEGGDDADRLPAERVILDRLAPLVEEGTIDESQAAAVAEELAPLVRRFRLQQEGERHRARVHGTARRVAEILEVEPEELAAQLEAGATLAEIAAAAGSTAGELVAALLEPLRQRLDEAVADGHLDEARAARMLEQAEERLSRLVDTEHPFRPVLREQRRHRIRTGALHLAGEVLGLPAGELRSRLQAGETLAEVAGSQGVAVDDLVAGLLEPLEQQLEVAVRRGRLSAEQAADRLASAEEQLRTRIAASPTR